MAAGYRMDQFVSTFSASGNPPKETCRQCRFRKVRCDGRRGEKGCGDCQRLKFDCSFVAAPPSTPTIAGSHFHASDGASGSGSGSALPSPTTSLGTEAARVVERRRTSKACTHCRQQKVRCSGGTPCIACKKKGVACAYGTDRRRGSRVATGNSSIAGTPLETSFPSNTDDAHGAADDASATSPTTPGTTSSEPATVTHYQARPGPLLLPPDLQALVESYFNNVYPLPSYAFLHPATTIRQCSEGGLETCLSYAISAVASYHRGPVQTRGDVELSWIQAAEDLIWKHLESPNLARLQALLLVVLYRVETGTVQRAFMLSSLAARAAAALRLNHERATASESRGNRVLQEIRRRTMWSLKLVERYFSVGLPEFELCPVDSIYLNLPCWERDFSSGMAGLEGCVDRSLQTCDFGSYRLYIKLEMLRRDIMKLTRSLAIYDSPFPQLASVMNDFEQQLSRVGMELPNGPNLNTDRISQLIGTPWLPRQVLVYLSYHQCHCDLYRLLLCGYREAVPTPVLDAIDQSLLVKAEQLCLQHATAIADILVTLNHQSQRAQLLEFDTAICAYHATRLLLFISRSGRAATRPSEEWALSRAELCVTSLRRFFLHSSLVRPVLEEMRRAIAGFSSQSTAATPNRVASPGPLAKTNNNNTTPNDLSSVSGLSAAARVRQRLAIHSLLRQADFTDDEDEQQQQQDVDTSSRRGSLVPQRGLSPGPADAELSKASSSSRSLSSPRPPFSVTDAESWSLQWLAIGELGDGRDADTQLTTAVGGGSTPSFSFPWLQRLETPRDTTDI